MKKFLYLPFLIIPFCAQADEHGGKAMKTTPPVAEQANEHAGQAVQKKATQASEHAGQSMPVAPKAEEGVMPLKKKTNEHAGAPMK